MTIPCATFTHAGSVRLHFPYSRRLVERLKRQVPSHSRVYAPDEKTWTVTADYAARAVRLLLAEYPYALVERPRTSVQPNSIRPTDHALAELHLLPSAPPELIEIAYRTLARLHHPDVGGDAETMKRLNAARDLLRDRIPA